MKITTSNAEQAELSFLNAKLQTGTANGLYFVNANYASVEHLKAIIIRNGLLPVLFPAINRKGKVIISGNTHNNSPHLFSSALHLMNETEPGVAIQLNAKSDFTRAKQENRNYTERSKTELNADQRDYFKGLIDLTPVFESSPVFQATLAAFGGDNPIETKILYDLEKKHLFVWFLPATRFAPYYIQDRIEPLFLAALLLYQNCLLNDLDENHEERLVASAALDMILNNNQENLIKLAEEQRNFWQLYIKEVGIRTDANWVEQLYGQIVDGYMAAKQERYKIALRDLKDAQFTYERALVKERKEAQQVMLSTPDPNLKQSFIEALEASQFIRKITYDKDKIYFHVVSPVNFEADIAKMYYQNPQNHNNKNKKYYCRYLKGIANGEFTHYLRGGISLYINSTDNNSNYDSAVRICDYRGPSTDPKSLPNPHYERANCLGTFRGEIFKAKIHDNWAGVVSLIEQAVGNLNIPDGGITEHYYMNYFSNVDMIKNIEIELPDKSITTLYKYLKEKGEV